MADAPSATAAQQPPTSEGHIGGCAQRFRKRPVEIEAVRVSDAMIGAARAWDWLPTWLAAAYERGEVLFLQGELYPCKPDIFEATYEPC